MNYEEIGGNIGMLDKLSYDALDSGIYTREEIDANFADFPIIPFLDDLIELAGIDSSYKDFGPNDDSWYDYLRANRERVLPKLLKKVKMKERNI